MCLTGYQPSRTNDAPQSQQEKEVEQERSEARPSHAGYGANKKFPYIDE